jgi:phosphate starvation-inducible protein PhoH
MSNRPKDRPRKSPAEKLHLSLQPVEALNEKQKQVLRSDENQVLYGCAGTGKTFLASYKAYEDIIVNNNFSELVYVRSAVSTRNIGFLPGSDSDKTKVYEAPYIETASKLFCKGSAYEELKAKKLVRFSTTSFARGITLEDCVVIVDEFQNLTFHELDTVITRVGKNCKIMFCGDTNQSDLSDSGFKPFMEILQDMQTPMDFVKFGVEDIVRSEFVKDYLTAKERRFESNSQQSNLLRSR